MSHIKLKKMKALCSKASGVKKPKSKSSSKKRFKLTATGLIVSGQANKRHNMLKHSSRQKKSQSGTVILLKSITRVIKKYCRFFG